MKLPAATWLRVVVLATALLFAAVLVYVYAIRYVAWLDSDAAVPALLAAKSLHAMSPVVTDWYYANGDVWVLTPHLIAILPVAILGLGVPALLVSTVIGFALEAVVLVKVYLRYGGELWIALLAMMATLMAWSNAHVAYTYVQLAYGFGTVLYLLTFHVFATIADDARARRRRFVVGALLVGVITVSNPTRGAVFLVAPILVGCAWPWRAFPVRRRFALAAAACLGWVVAYAVYTYRLAPIVTWSVPRGHVGVVLGGLKQIEANIAMLGRGLVLLCGGSNRSVVWAIPGLLILLGSLVLVVREALSRTFDPLRWVSVVVLGQLGVVLLPLLIANLLDSPEATRYLMSSLQAIVGLAVLIAVRTAGEVRRGWRPLAIVWLAALPIAAALAATDAAPTTTPQGIWRGGAGRIQPDGAELEKIADELVRRNLTHGFADNLSANLLTLQSHGSALTCHVGMYEFMMPLRWLGETSCYAADDLPDRFYVVAFQDEHERSAIRATLPVELERFSVGDTYEVHVFRTKDTSPAWLDLPILDRDLATFPIRIQAAHLQLRHANVTLESGQLVATGEPGTVVYGPYIDLPKGDYTASWFGGGIESTGQIVFRVTGATGNNPSQQLGQPVTLEAHAILRGRAELARIEFSAKRPVTGVEVVVESADGGRVSLSELVIERR